MTDILGSAILDYYTNSKPSKLWIHNTYGPKEEMPVGAYFRTRFDMPDLELTALNLCRGKVLDIGAGAGSHALILQNDGLDVTALDISEGAAEVMKLRGVKKIMQADVLSYNEETFDTLLLLMNGIGLTQTLDGMKAFFKHAEKLLKPNGQILFDSSDIAYLYEEEMPEQSNYYGEIMYWYEYKKQKGDWFKWLYVDKNTLKGIAVANGWKCNILEEDEFDQYLAQLTKCR